MDRIVKQITDKLYGEDNTPTKYRVWWVPQIPMKAFYYDVPDIKTGRLLEDVLAKYDIFQYENRVKPDFCNAGGIQRYDEAEQTWVDLWEGEED